MDIIVFMVWNVLILLESRLTKTNEWLLLYALEDVNEAQCFLSRYVAHEAHLKWCRKKKNNRASICSDDPSDSAPLLYLGWRSG